MVPTANVKGPVTPRCSHVVRVSVGAVAWSRPNVTRCVRSRSTPAATTPVNATVATVIDRGPAARKVVALTFDDGYAPVNVRSILEILVTEKVKATFFINGYYLSRDPQLWREVAAAGFPVGNHTYAHSILSGNTTRWIRKEIGQGARVVLRVTGRQPARAFRPPGGVVTDRVRQVAAEQFLRDAVSPPAQQAKHLVVQTRASCGRARHLPLAFGGGAGTPGIKAQARRQ